MQWWRWLGYNSDCSEMLYNSSGIDGISEFQVISMAGMSYLFAGIALWVPQNPAQDFRREHFL